MKDKEVRTTERLYALHKQAVQLHPRGRAGNENCGDTLHAVLCAARYNLCWLMRTVLRLGRKAFFALYLLIAALIMVAAVRTSPPTWWKIRYAG